MVQLIPDPSLTVSTLQSKLQPSEQYEHFMRTKLLGGSVSFVKIYKQYLEECFKKNDYKEIARIVADAEHNEAGSDVRTQ